MTLAIPTALTERRAGIAAAIEAFGAEDPGVSAKPERKRRRNLREETRALLEKGARSVADIAGQLQISTNGFIAKTSQPAEGAAE